MGINHLHLNVEKNKINKNQSSLNKRLLFKLTGVRDRSIDRSGRGEGGQQKQALSATFPSIYKR